MRVSQAKKDCPHRGGNPFLSSISVILQYQAAFLKLNVNDSTANTFPSVSVTVTS